MQLKTLKMKENLVSLTKRVNDIYDWVKDWVKEIEYHWYI